MTPYIFTTPKLLHVSFNFQGKVNKEALKKRFDLALDWIQYSPNCWIVRTNYAAQKWYEILKPVLGPRDEMFICKFDMSERQGWLSKWVWEWIQKYDK